MKPLIAGLGLLASLAASPSGFSSNIIWVSDMLNIGTTTVGAGPYADQGMVNLLIGAGHTVTRFNPADATAITAGEIATMNSANLVIIGKTISSNAFNGAALAGPWNTSITTPVMVTTTFMSRANRLGWFTGNTQPDQVSNILTFPAPANPVSSYIIGSVAMSGGTTASSITQAITYPDSAVDVRGTSGITEAPVAGATIIASTAGAGGYIVSWPSGTLVRGGADALAGFRMQFLAGNRESAAAPNNLLGSAGFENLTAEGEGMFLRAVEVALHNGAVPEPGTVTFILLAGSALFRRRRAA